MSWNTNTWYRFFGASSMLFLIPVVSGLIGAFWAQSKNKNWLLWGLLCLVFPIVGLVFLAFAKADVSQSKSVGAQPNSGDPVLVAPEHSASDYDERKWAALVEYDPEIRRFADEVTQMGPSYERELASSYLALNDKSYLPAIVEKLKSRFEAEAPERRRKIGEQVTERLVDSFHVFETENGPVFGNTYYNILAVTSSGPLFFPSRDDYAKALGSTSSWGRVSDPSAKRALIEDNWESVQRFLSLYRS